MSAPITVPAERGRRISIELREDIIAEAEECDRLIEERRAIVNSWPAIKGDHFEVGDFVPPQSDLDRCDALSKRIANLQGSLGAFIRCEVREARR